MSQPLATIIILNYNGGDHVVECLESIYNTKSADFELIFIDNNSSDGSQNVCREKFPQMRFIQNPKNEGMSARNIGLGEAHGKYVVFLDSDTIVTKGWLESFVASFEKHGEGLYGPKILKKGTTNVIETVGNMINVFGLGYASAKGQIDEGEYDQFKKISYPAGACVFSSRQVFDRIGPVDELFFAYHDDVDYGWRGLLLGIPSFFEPGVCIYHLSSPTLGWSKRKYFLLERNRWICLLSLYSTKSLIKLLPSLIVVEIGIFFYMLSKGMGLTKIHALFSLIGMSSKIRQKHLKTNTQRTQPDSKVLESFADDFVMPTFTTTESTSRFTRTFVYKLSKIARRVI